MNQIDLYIQSLTRLIESRHKKDACFPGMMPVDFARLNELRQILVSIEVIGTLFAPSQSPDPEVTI